MPRLELRSAAFFLLAVAYLVTRQERPEATPLPPPPAAAHLDADSPPPPPTLAALARENDVHHQP